MNINELRTNLEVFADPSRAKSMSAYMRNQFPFLGVPSPETRAAAKPLLATAKHANAETLIAFADDLWAQQEREFQYVACIALRKGIRQLGLKHLADIERYIVTKSRWDTVDSLAVWSIGPLVLANPSLVKVMDRWIDDNNIWLARTAILHQLSYKSDTDADRLFKYANHRAEDTEFFIRKAVGWSLREYAKQQPEKVRSFVATNKNKLSGLTKREALKHLNPSN